MGNLIERERANLFGASEGASTGCSLSHRWNPSIFNFYVKSIWKSFAHYTSQHLGDLVTFWLCQRPFPGNTLVTPPPQPPIMLYNSIDRSQHNRPVSHFTPWAFTTLSCLPLMEYFFDVSLICKYVLYFSVDCFCICYQPLLYSQHRTSKRQGHFWRL